MVSTTIGVDGVSIITGLAGIHFAIAAAGQDTVVAAIIVIDLVPVVTAFKNFVAMSIAAASADTGREAVVTV